MGFFWPTAWDVSEPLWNLTWPIVGSPDGSFSFDNQPNMLDHFLVNKTMAVDDAPIKADLSHGASPQANRLTSTGVYPKPIPFGGMGDPVNQAVRRLGR